jgi:hypothetical protein
MTMVDSEEFQPPSAVLALLTKFVAFRDESGNAFQMRKISNLSHTSRNPVPPLSVTGNLRPVSNQNKHTKPRFKIREHPNTQKPSTQSSPRMYVKNS